MVDGISWDMDRSGAPSKLSFDVYQDKMLQFEEGNVVMLKQDDVGVFYGFIFIKKRNPQKKTVKVTCYDQLRYLKNKETYSYKNKTASEVIKMIANDFRLSLGDIEDTKFKIESRIEENKTLLDIIVEALGITLENTGRMYVFYDDFGKLTLRDIESMKVDLLIDEATAGSYDYTTSIDGETYNKVKLTVKDEDAGVTEVYISQDSTNMNKWGILQYYESAKKGTSPKTQADQLLGLYNTKQKKISIKKVLGDLRLRAGASPIILMQLDDMKISNYMMIDKAKHKIKDNEHLVDLMLLGGGFNVV